MRFTKLRIISLVLLWVVSLTITNCSYRKKNILFKTPKKVKTKDAVGTFDLKGNAATPSDKPYKHIIKPGDRLVVNFLNNYDIGKDAMQSSTASANMQNRDELGYLVNYDSSVTLPLVGRVNLVGLDRLAAAKKLETEYGKFVINPIIEVNIANLSVTVLGEVLQAGKILLDKDNTSLVDVIALAGGLKDTGKKNRIRIVRGSEVILVNLRDINSLKNQAITIHDGDIVYAEPYGLKSQTEILSSLQNSTLVILTISQIVVIYLQIVNLSRTN